VRATNRLVELRLQNQVAHLVRLTDQLDAAVQADNRHLASAVVALWDSAASDLLGTIRDSAIYSEALRELVVASRDAGHIARPGLMVDGQPVAATVRTLRERMGEVIGDAGELAAARLSDSSPPASRG
jgi:hypothetical protein